MAEFNPTAGVTAGEDIAKAMFGDYKSPNWNNDAWFNFGLQYALSDYEFGKNREMWELMNEYNSPAAQMQRFKEAGLNPMLAYTQGTPGNATSQVQYSKPNQSFEPGKARMNQIAQATEILGAIGNLVNNVTGMFGNMYDVGLKRNELAWSDTMLGRARGSIIDFGDRNAFPRYKMTTTTDENGQEISRLPASLNPFSPDFSPLEYGVLTKLGKIPDYYNKFQVNLPQSVLTELKGEYQKYYNENLLPKFDEYQQGKIDQQALENALLDYNLKAREMIPPELRGILEPIFDWLQPFFKFIFKKSIGKFDHTVRQ